jgi:hypothetical protein
MGTVVAQEVSLQAFSYEKTTTHIDISQVPAYRLSISIIY